MDQSIPRITYKVPEVAEALGISRSRTYELIAAGEIPTIRIGKSVRCPVEGVHEFVARRLADASSVDGAARGETKGRGPTRSHGQRPS